MYTNNPVLNQQMAQLEQEFAQRKASLVQSFYSQNQSQNNWPQQSTQTAQPAPSQNVNWIQVNGVDGAKNQIVQPGQTAWMMDNNQPYFYVKSVDGVGSSSFRIFQFSEVQEAAGGQSQTSEDLSQYVHRDEFDALKAQLDQFVGSTKKVSVKSNKGAGDNV